MRERSIATVTNRFMAGVIDHSRARKSTVSAIAPVRSALLMAQPYHGPQESPSGFLWQE